nr:choline:ethanolaminephosphotransferase 1 [Hymenolepis microstoma]
MFLLGSTEHLSSVQLINLKEHKYSCRGSSISEKYFQVFWCSLVPYIPKRVAPNTITLTGLILNTLSVLILLCYSPDLKSDVPPWALVLTAICVFIYQTLDALDGKHARQTNTVSPLGELFDHGCDAVASVFVPLCLCVTVGIGTHPSIVFIQFFTFLAMFYLAHWQCYITGYLEFGKIDVTEGQISVMGLLLWTSVFGVEFWAYRIPLIGMPLKFLPFLVISAMALVNVRHFFTVLSQGGAGKAGTTVANTSVLFPAVPFGVVMSFAIIVAIRSPLHLYTKHLVLFLITFGFVAVKVILKLVVDHMTKGVVSLRESAFIGPALLFFNQYFNCPVPESWVLWSCMLIAVADVFLYSANVCVQIANYLNIYIFRVDKPPTLPSPSITQSGSSERRFAPRSSAIEGFTVPGSSTTGYQLRSSHYQRSKWAPR